MSLITAIIAAASGYAPLTSLLGSSPFRMFTLQLPQGSASPAIVLQVISAPQEYVFNARLNSLTARLQATIFGATPGGENARAVATAWNSFLDQFNGIGISGLSIYPNRVVGYKEFGIAETAPETFQIIVDAMIHYNQSVTG